MSADAAPFPSSIVVSTDMGQSWHPVVQRGEWRSLVVSQRFGSTAYVLTGLNQGYALLKTTDDGKTWTQLLPSLKPSRSISFVSPAVGFALGTEANANSILKTTDGGKTWITVGSLPEGTQSFDIVFVNENVGYVTVAPMETTSEEGNTMVMETQDGGKTWSPASFGALPTSILDRIKQHADIVEPVYFLPAFKSTPSQNWVLGTTGYPKLYTLISSDHGTVIEGTYDDPPGIEGYSFLSPDDGWMSVFRTQKSGSPDGESVIQQLDAKHGNWVAKWTLPTGWAVEGVYRLTEQDAWLVAQKPRISMNPTFAILRTTDGGKTWTRYQQPSAPEITPPPTTADSTFPIDFVNPNDGWLLTQQGLLKTTDGGASWTLIK